MTQERRPTQFPGFPTAYTEQDKERLVQLQEQRKALERAYKVKFAPEAWAKVPTLERGIRRVTPPFMAPIIGALPGEAETLEYGLTPEQFQERSKAAEEEFKELVRKERVTRLLPNIQSDLMIAALAGQPITETSELMSTFPELGADFTEEEIGYLARLGQALSEATPEQIMLGELFATEPYQLPFTKEDLDALFGAGIQDPRNIFATVEFAKGLEEVTAALKEAYPSQTPEDEAIAATRKRFREYFRQRNEALGITPEGVKPTKEAISELHAKVAEEEGRAIALVNETGELISARIKADGITWIGEDPIGIYDEDTKRVVPLDPFSGELMLTQEAQESKFKDFLQGIPYALHQQFFGSKMGIAETFRAIVRSGTLTPLGKKITFGVPGFPGQEEFQRKLRESLIGAITRWTDENELINQEWLKDHPELAPRPEWQRNPLEHPEMFLDPLWYFNVMSTATINMGASAITGIAVFGLTRNPFLASVVAVSVMHPFQLHDIREDAIASGASPEQADELAMSTALVVDALEIVPEMLLLKYISPMFMGLFRRTLQKEVVGLLVRKSLARTALEGVGILTAESAVEVIQQGVQNAFIKTVDENRSLVQDLDRTFVESMIGFAPMILGGGAGNYISMKRHLPQEVQEEIDTRTEELVGAKIEPELAEAIAITEVLETETGQAQVEEAIEKVTDVLPTNDKIIKLEERITSYVGESEVLQTSLEAQQARFDNKNLTSSERMEAKGAVDSLQDTLADIEKSKKALQKKIAKARKELVVTPEAVPEVTPEVTEEGVFLFRGLNFREIEGGIGIQVQNLETGEWIDTAVLNRRTLLADFTEVPDIGMWSKERASLGSLVFPSEVAKPPAVEVPPAEVRAVPEVIQTEPVERVTFEQTAPFAAEWAVDPLLPTRRPRTIDWDTELALEEESLKDSDMSKYIKLPKKVIAMRQAAETNLNRLQDEFKVAKKSKDKEAIKEAERKLKELANESGLRRKALLGKRWDDLDPDTQKQVALSLLPDGSLEFKARKEFLDMEYFIEFLQELTGLPFYPLIRRIEAANAAAETAKELVLQAITTNPYLREVRTDDVAKEKVAQEINARNEAQGVEHPDLTEDEMMMADIIESVYNYYKPFVRYLRVMRLKPTKEQFLKEFPDAVADGKEVELVWALDLRKKGNLDDLWAYLFDKTWGVIEHGFDPRLIADPTLRIKRKGGNLEITRGKARLMRREAIEYPAGKFSKDVLARLAAYVEQIELQWRVEPELDTFNDYWDMVDTKFSDWGDLKRGLETWVARIQNIGLGYNWADRQVRRLWRQSMAAVFLEPYMAFRNSWQAIEFHPDRTELFRIIKKHLPDALSQKADLYFKTFVSQLGGLRRDWLHVGERGFLVPDAWNRLADSLSLYGWSDHFPRMWSFKAALAKANRATEQYLQDKDVPKWLKSSGVIHLRDTEKNFALNYLNHTDKTFDMGLRGLREIKGSDMVSLYIAQRIADMTHFKYRRSSRGLLEMGVTGSTLWNLIVFPRGYAQRLYFQAEKIKNTFSGETSWNEARTGFNDIMKLIIISSLSDELFSLITGRKRNPWNPMNILFGWEFGGLFVGIAQDVTVFIGAIATLLNPLADDDAKDRAWGDLPMLVERLPETLVPIYRRAVDVGETIWTGVTGKDIKMRNVVRMMRGWLDEHYTPSELDDLDMELWEVIRKVILGGQPVDPTELEETKKRVGEGVDNLGIVDIAGRFFTLGDLGSLITSETREVPTIFMTEQEGWSPVVLFYKDCETQWDELYKLPAGSKAARLRGTDERSKWREEHILEEAMLLFWEKYDKSVFRQGSREAEEVKSMLQMWFDLYNIDKAQHGHWADWRTSPIPLPE